MKPKKTKAFVFSNLATSLDGKIAPPDQALFPLGTKEDLRRLVSLRTQAHVVLMGASTLRAYKNFCDRPKIPNGSDASWVTEVDTDVPVINAVLSRKLEGISPSLPFFKAKNRRRILFLTGKPDKKRLIQFEKTSEIVFLKKPTRNLGLARQIVQHFEGLQLSRVLVEGGGELIFQFLSENALDQMFVTLTPTLIGGPEAPSLVAGTGFNSKSIRRLKLLRSEVLGDEHYLVYRVHRG